MLLRFIRMLLAPAVMKDADRLVRSHGAGAAYLARHAAAAAGERASEGHWSRVLAEIESRVKNGEC